MNQDPLVNNPPWAKLIAVQPDKQNIALYPNRNDEHPFANEWSISQNQDGKIYIKNISASYLRVEETVLQINQEKELEAGERLCLNKKKKNFDYMFCVVNFHLTLNRDRDEVTESQTLSKFIKFENDLQKELTCPICTNYLEKCTILTPCLHTFCSFCLFHQLKCSNKCPLCRVEAVSVTKNSVLSNIVQLVEANFTTLQKSHERKELEEINFGGSIVRNALCVYIGSYVNGKKDGQGKFIWTDGEIYEGGWKNDKREGKGVHIYNDGGKYDGYWMNGNAHGTGKFIWSNGQEYEGDFQNNARHGYGIMKYKDGSFYKGDWKNGKQEGKGVLTYSDEEKYVGDFMNGVPQGKGKLIWRSGQEYEGDFQDSYFAGFGIMKYAGGMIYQGGWKNDIKEGLGVLSFPNGDKYEGRWVNGFAQPEVKVEYSNGDKYEGNIDVNSLEKQGKGILILSNGDKYKGNWVDNILQPQVTIEYANGDTYKGKISVENLQKHGKGVLTFKNGDVYEGDWVNDKQHGQGKEISMNGKRTFQGVWNEGRINGKVIMTDMDGKRYQVEMKKLEIEDEKDSLSENTEIDDSKTQDSDHLDRSEN